MQSLLPRLFVLVLLVAFSTSCSMLKWGRDKAPSDDAAAAPAAMESSVGTIDQERARLDALVRDRVQRAGATANVDNAEVVRRTPYFFKELNIYPEGAAGMEIDIRETESRTMPYAAEVTLNKQRYSTAMHRKRQNAREDGKFFRDTGVETITYELRNGNWVQAGSLFMASKVEENINGEWVLVQNNPETSISAPSAEQGFFGRFWSRLRGGV